MSDIYITFGYSIVGLIILIPTILPASARRSVTSMSSRLGVGSPDGCC